MLPKEVSIICKINIIKYLLNRLVLQGRLMRWAIKLHAFALNYVPLKAIKGHALVNFVAQHPCIETNGPLVEVNSYLQLKPWLLTFNGSKTQKDVGAGITITSPG